ncbi:MAG: S8 family serine peptidase [Acidimicrobiales bacterium]
MLRHVLVPMLAAILVAAVLTASPSAAGSRTPAPIAPSAVTDGTTAAESGPVAADAESVPAPAVDRTRSVEPPSVAAPLPSSDPSPSSWDGVVGGTGRQLVDDRPPDSSSTPLPGDLRRLQVKFNGEGAVALVDGSLDDGIDDSPLDRVLGAIDGLAVEPLFAQPPPELAATRSLAEARSGTALPDLASWFVLTVGSDRDGAALRDALEELEIVEMVQPDPELVATQIVDPEEDNQRYLDVAPVGHGAEWAWPQPGGTGDRVTIAVIDSGFDTSHPDVDRADAPGVRIPHRPARDLSHGLQVLGILVADDDDAGIRGIAHDARIRIINSGSTGADAARAVGLATAALGPGDVLSISQGIRATSGSSIVLPLVYSASVRDALRTAAAKGIITVVSAGNGGANLDTYADRLGNDSPATIVVGAGGSGPVPGCGGGTAGARVAVSNYGSRVDLQGWGECVRTTTIGNSYRWWGFTSAATPMVAGAAALVSSMYEAQNGVTPTGRQVRRILRSSGLPQVGSATIGPRPDLRSAMGVVGEMPDNDMWARAERLRDLPARVEVDTTFAGVELDEPDPGCGPMSSTVWYRIDAPRDLALTVDTIGSDHDTVVAVWRQEGRTLQLLGCNDDIGPRSNRSRLSTDLGAGGTYFLQVGAGREGRRGLVVRVRADSVVGAGCDVDGNGGADLLAGTPDEGIGSARRAGQVGVYPDWSRRRPLSAVRVTQEWPGVPGDSEPNDAFGAALACGDFDGDGYDDLAIGSPTESVGRRRAVGAVRVIPGGPGGPARSGARTLVGDDLLSGRSAARDRLGAALAVGDFDGDGYDDLAVGVPGEDLRGSGTGAVVVIPGGPGGLDTGRAAVLHAATRGIPGKPVPDAEFGAALAAGDIDYDGADDLVIGVPGARVGRTRAAGAIVVVHGSTEGLDPRRATRLHEDTRGVAGDADRDERFGAVLAMGYLGADVFADVVVGVPGRAEAGGSGGALAIRGTRNGLRPGSSVMIEPAYPAPGAGDRFGAALAIGDVDGDGLGDVVIGAPGSAAGGAEGAGAAQVRFSLRVGVRRGADLVLAPGMRGVGRTGLAGENMGAAVAVVDVDGDGRGLIVAGVPGAAVPGRGGGVRPAAGQILVLAVSSDQTVTGSALVVTQRQPKAGGSERGDRFGSVLWG